MKVQHEDLGPQYFENLEKFLFADADDSVSETKLQKTQTFFLSRKTRISKNSFSTYLAKELANFFACWSKLDRDDDDISNLSQRFMNALEQGTDLEVEEVDVEGNCQFDAVSHQLVRCGLRKVNEVF